MNGWTDTTRELPGEREYVRFIVIGHMRALMGVYEDHTFCSRWGTYATSQVKIWCRIEAPPHAAAPLPRERRYWSERPMREG